MEAKATKSNDSSNNRELNVEYVDDDKLKGWEGITIVATFFEDESRRQGPKANRVDDSVKYTSPRAKGLLPMLKSALSSGISIPIKKAKSLTPKAPKTQKSARENTQGADRS